MEFTRANLEVLQSALTIMVDTLVSRIGEMNREAMRRGGTTPSLEMIKDGLRRRISEAENLYDRIGQALNEM